MQMLFQWDITHDAIEQIVAPFWEGQDEPEDTQTFADSLAAGTVANVEKIDALITRHAENWRLDRMAVVDRNILRLAVYELAWLSETPAAVVLDEAIEVGKKFGSEQSGSFINGILDAVRKRIERGEIPSARTLEDPP